MIGQHPYDPQNSLYFVSGHELGDPKVQPLYDLKIILAEFLFFGEHSIPHWCFRDKTMMRTGQSFNETWFEETKRVSKVEDVVSVRTKRGRPVGFRGWGKRNAQTLSES